MFEIYIYENIKKHKFLIFYKRNIIFCEILCFTYFITKSIDYGGELQSFFLTRNINFWKIITLFFLKLKY